MAEGVDVLTDSTFEEEVAGSDVTMVVDFWAEWCGPCRMVAPVLDQIAAENPGKVRIWKLNVDDNPASARKYQVMSIPTLLVFKDGVAKKRIVGAKAKAALMDDLSRVPLGRIPLRQGPRTRKSSTACSHVVEDFRVGGRERARTALEVALQVTS